MKRFLNIVISVFVLLVLFSCSESNSEEDPAIKKTLIPVEVAIAKKKMIDQKIPLSGVLQPLNAVDIIAETSGLIKKINKNLGDKVSKKDVLAVIDDRVPLSQYRQAKAQVLSAENNLEIAKLNLESDKVLYEAGDISKLEYQNTLLSVKTAEANHLSALANLSLTEKTYLDTKISSEINGTISRKNVELGTMVNIGMPVYRVVNLSTFKIEAGVPQNLIGLIHKGSPAEIIISALNGKVVMGTVRFISPQADENTGTFLTEIHVKNTKNNEIRAGMTTRINLSLSGTTEQIIIPNYALVTKNGSDAVYKINKNKGVLTNVTVGQTVGSQVVLSEGVVNGDTIVVVGMKNLGLNTPVTVENIHSL